MFPAMEKVKFGTHVLDLPQELCKEEIFNEVLSADVWDSVLTESQRSYLSTFLPAFPENCAEEKQATIQALFNRENFKFGSPLCQFWKNMCNGLYSPGVSRVSEALKKIRCKEYKRRQRKYFCKLLQTVLISRKKSLESAARTPPDQPIKYELPGSPHKKNNGIEIRTKRRYFKELQDMYEELGEVGTSSDDDNYPDKIPQKLSKRQKRILEASLGPDSPSVSSTFANRSQISENGKGGFNLATMHSMCPFDVTEDRYRELLLQHKKKRSQKECCPELDVRGITLQDVIARSSVPRRTTPRQLSSSETSSKRKGRDKERSDRKSKQLKATADVSAKSMMQLETSKPLEVAVDLLKDIVIKKEPLDVCDVPQDMNVEAESNDEGDIGFNMPRSSTPSLFQVPYSSFFSLLRDLMCETPEGISTSKLEESVQVWQESPFSVLNDWFMLHGSWSELVLAALKFLAGLATSSMPSNFVTCITYHESAQLWQWSEKCASDVMLASFCTHWFESRIEEMTADGNDTVVDVTLPGSPPPSRIPTDWFVRPTTDEEKQIFQEQERRRYSMPHKAFTFQMHGYESVVGPVKGVYNKDSAMNKAREHSLLVSDRPPFVTILSLVRDAASRLPNGEGTRSDICELLKDSQYFATPNEAQLKEISAVVSGALDRLHYEKDPCVKYDVNRKIWIYLHRFRTEEEFERIHQAQATVAKSKKSVTKTKIKHIKNKDTSRPASSPNVTSSDSHQSSELISLPTTMTSIISSSSTGFPMDKIRSKVTPTSQAGNSLTQNVTSLNSPISNIGGSRTAGKSAGTNSLGSSVRLAPETMPISVGMGANSGALPTLGMQHSASNLSSHTGKSVATTGAKMNPQLLSVSQVQVFGTNLGKVSVMPSKATNVSLQPSLQTEIKGSTHLDSTNVTIMSPTSTQAAKLVSAILAQQPQSSKAAKTIITSTMTPQSTSVMQQSLARTSKDHSVILTGTHMGTTVAVTKGTMKFVPSTIVQTQSGSTLSSSSTMQNMPTIVIKQEGGSQLVSASGITRTVTSTSKPVVARIISSPQVVSVGNLIASTVSVNQKPGATIHCGATSVKIQGSNLLRPVGSKPGQMSLIQTPSNTTAVGGLPRLALVSQGNTTNLVQVSGTTVTTHPKLMATAAGQLGFVTSQPATQHQMSSGVKPAILTASGGIKIVSGGSSNVNLAQFGAKTTVGASKAASVTVTTSGSSSPNLVISENSQASTPTVVITPQGTLKSTQTLMMTAGVQSPTVIMTTQPGLRPVTTATVSTANMKTLKGVKVIPITQAAGAGSKGNIQPMYARIITSPGGLTIRSAVPTSTVATGTQQNLSVLQSIAQVPANVSTSGTVTIRTPGTTPSNQGTN